MQRGHGCCQRLRRADGRASFRADPCDGKGCGRCVPLSSSFVLVLLTMLSSLLSLSLSLLLSATATAGAGANGFGRVVVAEAFVAKGIVLRCGRPTAPKNHHRNNHCPGGRVFWGPQPLHKPRRRNGRHDSDRATATTAGSATRFLRHHHRALYARNEQHGNGHEFGDEEKEEEEETNDEEGNDEETIVPGGPQLRDPEDHDSHLFRNLRTPKTDATTANNNRDATSIVGDANDHGDSEKIFRELAWRTQKVLLEEQNDKRFAIALRSKPRKLPYEDAKLWVRKNLGPDTRDEFDDLVLNGNLRTPYIPKDPERYYTGTGAWKGWEDFLSVVPLSPSGPQQRQQNNDDDEETKGEDNDNDNDNRDDAPPRRS